MPDLKSRGDESALYVERLKELYKCLLLDVGSPGLVKDLETVNQRLTNEGFSFVSKTMPALAKALDRGLANGCFKCPSSFKRKKRASALPALLGSLFSNVFDDSGFLLPHPSTTSIKTIRTICLFAYKCDLPRKEEIDRSVVDRFVAVEQELARLEIGQDRLLDVSNLLTRGLFEDYDPENISPRHGPGVTSTAVLTQKFEHRLGHSPCVSAFGKSFFFNEEDALTRLSRYPVYSHETLYRQKLGAKVILVPKDSRGPRLISCEPAEHQWVQQGIARYMIDKLETADLTAGHVNFCDQTINRRLAATGSVTQKWATLDLKDASDRVSLDLVYSIFSGTKLLPSLLLSRSEFTDLPDGTRLGLRKFAPMGSALCFPVMAYCIFILLYVSFIGVGMTDADARASIYVYGDDVIVPSHMAQYTISVLERYGLRINRDKSFVDSPFLESCGMDAFRGVDVTPIRLKRCPTTLTNLRKDPQTAVSIVETANRLRAEGYIRTSQLLYGWFERCYGRLLYGYQHSSYLCRWVLPSDRRTAEELNAITIPDRPLRGKAGERGHRGHFVTPVKISDSEVTTYGHFMRIWSQLGSGDPLPLPGVFAAPKSYEITGGLVSRLDQSENPAAKLPWM